MSVFPPFLPPKHPKTTAWWFFAPRKHKVGTIIQSYPIYILSIYSSPSSMIATCFFGKPPTSSNQGQPASHAEARLLAWIFCRAMSSVPLAFQTWGCSGARGTGRKVERLKERAGTVLEQSDIYLFIYVCVCGSICIIYICIYIYGISISGKYLMLQTTTQMMIDDD